MVFIVWYHHMIHRHAVIDSIWDSRDKAYTRMNYINKKQIELMNEIDGVDEVYSYDRVSTARVSACELNQIADIDLDITLIA